MSDVTNSVSGLEEDETGLKPLAIKVPDDFPITLFTADGVALKNPSSFDVHFKDLDSAESHTSETGHLNRDMIRADHVTFPVQWVQLRSQQLGSILAAVSGKESFQLKYYDVRTASFSTGKFYATDRQISGKLITEVGAGLYSLQCSFIEF